MEKIWLEPNDGRKSFYKKAYVIEEVGSRTLYSYNTPILREDATGYTRLWDGYSATTQRHINAFCGMGKKEFTSMEVGK